MSDTITVTCTYPVTRGGDKFAVDGLVPRTRKEWEKSVTTLGDIARAMVAYIDSLPENQPQGYGFLGTLDVDGEEYDVIRGARGDYGAISRTRDERLLFSFGGNWTPDWSDILAAGKFTPRDGAK